MGEGGFIRQARSGAVCCRELPIFLQQAGFAVEKGEVMIAHTKFSINRAMPIENNHISKDNTKYEN